MHDKVDLIRQDHWLEANSYKHSYRGDIPVHKDGAIRFTSSDSHTHSRTTNILFDLLINQTTSDAKKDISLHHVTMHQNNEMNTTIRNACSCRLFNLAEKDISSNFWHGEMAST